MSGSGSPIQLAVDGRRLAWTVLAAGVAAEVAWFLLDYHVNYGRGSEIGAVRRLFNTAREDSLSSWFAATQTWMVALTLWLLAAVQRHSRSAWAVAGWMVLAAFFTYMAADDGAKIHERLGTAFEVTHRDAPAGSWGRTALDRFPSYRWQIVLLPVFAALGLFTLGFLCREIVDRPGRAMVVTAVACFALAVAFDFVEGLDPEHPWNLHAWLAERMSLEPGARRRFGQSAFRSVRHFSKSLEECLEMLATTLLWCVLLRHLARIAPELRIRLAPTGTS